MFDEEFEVVALGELSCLCLCLCFRAGSGVCAGLLLADAVPLLFGDGESLPNDVDGCTLRFSASNWT